MNVYTKKFLNICGFIVGCALNIIIFLSCAYLIYLLAVKAFNVGTEFADQSTVDKPYREIVITLDEDTPVQEVAEMLEEEEIVYNSYIYVLENMLKGSKAPYVAGTFTLNTTMSTSDINRTFRKAAIQSTDQRITIVEGLSTKEIGRYLENQGIITEAEFIEACNTAEFKYSFLQHVPYRENRLEGYLFPDTYFISQNPTATEIIDKMLSRFEEIYTADYEYLAEQRGLTLDEVIIIASIIEKEISQSEERAMASSVIYNRLAQGMNLQMCSTVLYTLDKKRDKLLEVDLQIESPYNTYLKSGLPVGPIGNPGKACIEAALNPIDSNLLYFVVKDAETGEHFFTDNYDEFVSAKQLYNQFY